MLYGTIGLTSCYVLGQMFMAGYDMENYRTSSSALLIAADKDWQEVVIQIVNSDIGTTSLETRGYLVSISFYKML